MAKRKEKEDLFATLHHPVFLFPSRCHTSSSSLPFPFSLPHFFTQSSFSVLFDSLHHSVFLFLSLCHTSSPSLSFPFSLPHFITQSSFSFLFSTLHHPVFLGKLGEEVWQREMKKKTE
jgi:hypothetical protein